MKKVLIAIALLTSVSSLSAKNFFTDNPNYIQYNVGKSFVEKGEKSLGEPLENIVGGDSVRHEIEFGKQVNGRKGIVSKVFLYAWKYDENKHNEIGLGMGFRQQTPKYYFWKIPVRFEYIAKVGLGSQSVKGDTLYTDTNVNVVNYVTGEGGETGRFKAKYDKDTSIVEMGLGVGFVINITKKIDLQANYTYLHHYTNYGYTVEGAPVATYISGTAQSNHTINVGLSYKF